jgi:hypothetical protein
MVSIGPVCTMTLPLIPGTVTPSSRFCSLRICCMILSLVELFQPVLSDMVSDIFSNNQDVFSVDTTLLEPLVS